MDEIRTPQIIGGYQVAIYRDRKTQQWYSRVYDPDDHMAFESPLFESANDAMQAGIDFAREKPYAKS